MTIHLFPFSIFVFPVSPIRLFPDLTISKTAVLFSVVRVVHWLSDFNLGATQPFRVAFVSAAEICPENLFTGHKLQNNVGVVKCKIGCCWNIAMLKTKLYDNSDDCTFPIVNFRFIIAIFQQHPILHFTTPTLFCERGFCITAIYHISASTKRT
jgi:hypothetical protein